MSRRYVPYYDQSPPPPERRPTISAQDLARLDGRPDRPQVTPIETEMSRRFPRISPDQLAENERRRRATQNEDPAENATCSRYDHQATSAPSARFISYGTDGRCSSSNPHAYRAAAAHDAMPPTSGAHRPYSGSNPHALRAPAAQNASTADYDAGSAYSSTNPYAYRAMTAQSAEYNVEVQVERLVPRLRVRSEREGCYHRCTKGAFLLALIMSLSALGMYIDAFPSSVSESRLRAISRVWRCRTRPMYWSIDRVCRNLLVCRLQDGGVIAVLVGADVDCTWIRCIRP